MKSQALEADQDVLVPQTRQGILQLLGDGKVELTLHPDLPLAGLEVRLYQSEVAQKVMVTRAPRPWIVLAFPARGSPSGHESSTMKRRGRRGQSR